MSTTSTPRPTRLSRPRLQISVNNLVKRVKRVAFGFRRFHHYRIRSLLYAGKPNRELLDNLIPP
jgi:hypothetical protein